MKNSLKKVFNLNEAVELSGNILTVYHLTGSKKFSEYSPSANFALNRKRPSKPRKVKDRTQSILNTIEYKEALSYSKKPNKEEIELLGVTDLLADPFTKGTGFSPGSGAMYGPGLYTCYDFNPSIAHVYGDICLKFEVDISNYLIFFEDLAKQVHGENWRIEDQVKNLFNGKFKSLDQNTDIHRTKEDLISFCVNLTRNISGKSYKNPSDLTSGTALKFTTEVSSKYTANFLTSFFDGIIFRGRNDGPVCVIYNPQRKAEIIQIGRVTAATTEIDWKNSLKEFFPSQNVIDIDFRSLNDISNENDTDETMFHEKQENYLKELIPTLALNNEIADVVEDPGSVEVVLQNVLNDIVYNDKKINPVFINSVLGACLSNKINKLFKGYNITNRMIFQAITEINKANSMNHLTLKSLDLLTEIALKIGYFNDSTISSTYSLFIYALGDAINSGANTSDYEKYSNIYLNNSSKINPDIILSLGRIYEETGKSFFSKKILEKYLSTNNNNIVQRGLSQEIISLDYLNINTAGLGMSESDVLSVFEKITLCYKNPGTTEYKLFVCDLALTRSLITNIEIQKFVAEQIEGLTPTMLANTKTMSSDGIFEILKKRYANSVQSFLVNTLIDSLMRGFESLSSSSKEKVDDFFKNAKIEEELLMSVNNTAFLDYYEQIRDKKENWELLITELENCQSVAEIEKTFKNAPRATRNNIEFIKKFLSGVASKKIIPHMSQVYFAINNLYDSIDPISFDDHMKILLSCLERLNEKPNSLKTFESLSRQIYQVARKNTTDYLKLMELIKSVPNKIFKSIEIGRVTYHEGHNILYEIISYDDQSLTQFFRNMNNLMITKIVKDLFDSVEYVITRHQTGYLPREGIIKFVNYLLNNKTLTPAVKAKVNTILDSVNQNSENIADALIRKYINLIIH